MAGVLKRQLLLTHRDDLGSPPVFGWVRVAHLFNFLCCVVYFLCLRPVSCVPNVARLSRLFIIDCPFGFL
jgi:hypothetical protein